jgi:hypothetical protein
VRIPAEARVLVLYASANRDPAAWTDAGEPVLDRPNAASHLAFGRGVHACIGAALARAEGRIALEHLLRRLDAFELAADPAEIEYLASAVNHGPARLPLRLTWAQAAGVIDRDPDGIHAKGRFRSITQAGTHQSIEARQRWEGGVYENRYVKEDGRWRIQRLDFRQVWHCTYEHGWAYMGMDYPDYITERHPADPYGPDESWHMFPDTRLIDFHYPHPITGEWVTSDLGGPPPSS